MNKSLYVKEPEFEANIYIYTEEEGGRHGFNGIRWDFRYAKDDGNDIYMIWAEFIDGKGELISPDIKLIGTYRANMYVVKDEMKEFHKEKINVGVEFYMVDGAHKVAKGTVARVFM